MLEADTKIEISQGEIGRERERERERERVREEAGAFGEVKKVIKNDAPHE